MSNIVSTWEKIGPAKAMKYIETMNGNRPVRQPRVDFLANQMAAGKWRKTHQGIAFDTEGRLSDGQHRMWAIVETGLTLEFMVTRGVAVEDVTVFDTGLARNYSDAANFAGWNANPSAAALAKALARGITLMTPIVPADVIHNWYEFYKKQIDFAISLRSRFPGPLGKKFTLPMLAAFARASHTIDVDLLERFASFMRDGKTEFEADDAASVFRDAWMAKRLGTTGTETYFKTCAALRAFAARRSIKQLARVEGEVFDLPPLPTALRYSMKKSDNSPRAGKAARAAAMAAAA